MESILSDMLDAGLLPIAEDDTKLQILEASSNDIAELLQETPILFHRFTLVALNNRVRSEDPVLAIVEQTIKKRWNTISNRIGHSPVQVYRFLLIRAIQIAAERCAKFRYAAELIAKNQSPLILEPSERAPIEKLINTFRAMSFQDLESLWIAIPSIQIPTPKKKQGKQQSILEELTTFLQKAVGPTTEQGKSVPHQNPFWPNDPENWAKHFPRIAAQGITNAIQKFNAPLQEEIKESAFEALESLVKSLKQLLIRDAKSELLWLQMSNYSPSAKVPYENLTTYLLTYHAALDVSNTVESYAPESVEHFLKNLVNATQKNLEPVNIGDALKEMERAHLVQNSSPIETDRLGETGIRPWIQICLSPNPNCSFAEQAGLDCDQTAYLSDISVSLFRELQVNKLLRN